MGQRTAWTALFVVAAIGVYACGDDAVKMDPCMNGICPDDAGGVGGTSGVGAMGGSSGTSGAGATGGTSGAGATSGSGGMSGVGATGGTGGMSGAGATGGTSGAGATSGSGGMSGAGATGGTGGTCVESWLCAPWTTNGSNDNGMRVCTDRNACGTTVLKPMETATLPALDFNYYQCKVEPILDKSCAHMGCHGTEQGRALRVYARGRRRMTGESLAVANLCLKPPSEPPIPAENCNGSVECACWARPHTANEWRANFDSARGFALDANGQLLSNLQNSELLTQPLVGGGLPHAGIKFWGATDQEFADISAWLTGQTLSSCGLPQSQN